MYLWFFQLDMETSDFQLFTLAALLEMKVHQTVLVVCPFKSIIEDQIVEEQNSKILWLRLQIYLMKSYGQPISAYDWSLRRT